MEREIIEEKIQDLIDGKLSREERVFVEKEILKDEQLKRYYSTLKEVHLSLNQMELLHPPEKFTNIVMQGLHRPKLQSFDYRSVFIFIGIVICAAVGLVFSSQVKITVPALSPVSKEISIPMVDELIFNLPGIDLPSTTMMLNFFYFFLLFMALIYFDRVILKQIFRGNKYSM